MIESHKKQITRQKHDDFVQDELKRLNAITVDNYKNLEHIQPTTSQGISFLPGPHLRPSIGIEEEKKKISESISRKLSGVNEPEHADISVSKSRWAAFIDSNDGTLTYYNKFTGIKTKTRPIDFDGTLPISSTSLTSNWTLKYDPIRKNNYYYNSETKEVRWIDENSNAIQHFDKDLDKYNVENPKNSKPQTHTNDLGKPNVKIKTEIDDTLKRSNESVANLLNSNSNETNKKVKNEMAIRDNQHVQQLAPLIGDWKIVEPKDSEFSHSIEYLGSYCTSSDTKNENQDNEDSVDQYSSINVDDLKLIKKPTYTKRNKLALDGSEDFVVIPFAKRKLFKRKNTIDN